MSLIALLGGVRATVVWVPDSNAFIGCVEDSASRKPIVEARNESFEETLSLLIDGLRRRLGSGEGYGSPDDLAAAQACLGGWLAGLRQSGLARLAASSSGL
jgi:hypothetical protein